MSTSARISAQGAPQAARLTAAVLAATVLGACTVGPNFTPPAPPRIDRYDVATDVASRRVEADGAAQTIELGRPTDPAWWRLFRSPALDAVVAAGLHDSPTLDAARATLDASRNEARAGAGVFYPWADVGASGGPHHSTPVLIGIPGGGYFYGLYTMSGAVTYALDLFGGERRHVEALNAAAESRRYAAGSAYLLLTGSIVQASTAHAGYEAEVRVLVDIVARAQARREIAVAENQAGRLAYSDVLDADQALAGATQDLAFARQQDAASLTLLHTLAGREPGEALTPLPTLDDLSVPEAAPVSLPSQLVHARPDILQAEADLHRSSAEVGVATAALYPSITLTAGYGRASANMAGLNSQAGRFWNYGPAVDLPILSGGARWYERRAAQAAYRETLSGYRTTVLAALEQTADALRALDADADTARASRTTYDAAVLKAQLAETRHKAGLISEDETLGAEIDAARARLGLISAKSRRLQDIVALYVACGGGWTGET